MVLYLRTPATMKNDLKNLEDSYSKYLGLEDALMKLNCNFTKLSIEL